MPAKLSVPSPSELRDSYLRTVRAGLVARGVPNPNVTRGSDHWIRAEALAQQLAVVFANQQVAIDAVMPDTAEGDDLIRDAAIYGISPVGATPSAGPIIFNSSASSFVAAGSQLADSRGQFFQVTTGATYANGAIIPVAGLSTGKATNLPQGTVLQWVTPPSFSAASALVGVGGLIGGADTDGDETLRNRLFTHLRNAPQAGNWSQIATWATEASASVQQAFVYRAINGPATVGVCVLGPPAFDATNGWTREVSSSVLTTVTNYIAAKLPEGPQARGLLVVTPTDASGAIIDGNVAIGLQLPLSLAAGGPGGGWVDEVPWPELDGTATSVFVGSVTSSTSFDLTSDDSATTPTTTGIVPGETTVCWFSSANYSAGLDPLIIATVTGVSGSTGNVHITIDTPFTGVASGDYVFPNAVRAQEYAAAFLASMAQMGPGQWTSHPEVLRFAKRFPLVTQSNPSDFTGVQLRAISDVGEEVFDVQYLHKELTTPGVPANTTSASPLVFAARRFGFFNKIPS